MAMKGRMHLAIMNEETAWSAHTRRPVLVSTCRRSRTSKYGRWGACVTAVASLDAKTRSPPKCTVCREVTRHPCWTHRFRPTYDRVEMPARARARLSTPTSLLRVYLSCRLLSLMERRAGMVNEKLRTIPDITSLVRTTLFEKSRRGCLYAHQKVMFLFFMDLCPFKKTRAEPSTLLRGRSPMPTTVCCSIACLLICPSFISSAIRSKCRFSFQKR